LTTRLVAALGLHRGLTPHTVESQQRQADVLGVPTQLPRSFGRGSPAKAVGLVRMQTTQQVLSQPESTETVEFGDLRKQAFESNPPWISREPSEGGALAVIGQKRVQLLAHSGIKAASDSL
jgi:hypothetical protein